MTGQKIYNTVKNKKQNKKISISLYHIGQFWPLLLQNNLQRSYFIKCRYHSYCFIRIKENPLFLSTNQLNIIFHKKKKEKTKTKQYQYNILLYIIISKSSIFTYTSTVLNIFYSQLYEWDWTTGYAYTSSLLFACTRYTFSNKCLSIKKLYQ